MDRRRGVARPELHEPPARGASALGSCLAGRQIDLDPAQLAAAQDAVRDTLGENLVALYLYGSAVIGGLRPNSDLDLLAIVGLPTSVEERRLLVERLTPISQRSERPEKWRPLELTAVVASDIRPWQFPPRTDFQHGEWLRDRFVHGKFDPELPHNADLAILLAMVRQTGKPLIGPAAAELIGEIPQSDLDAALTGVIPDLVADLSSDTANVLLTLARIWHTRATAEFAPKDIAAGWAMDRLPAMARPPLERAVDVYLGIVENCWSDLELEARSTATKLLQRIGQ